VPLLFALTLLVGASLLFSVQPMIAKMVLPLLGGAPAVWNTCMVFFQAALLAGYAYAHATASWLGVRRQAVLHLGLLLVPLALLPIGIAEDAARTLGPGANPSLWLLGLLATTVGLPFFVVSATAPMLQRWFSRTGHASASDPYFLYAASNLGSMLALLAYPLVLEPTLRLSQQGRLWAAGYGVLVVLTLACATAVWRRRDPAAPADEAEGDATGGDRIALGRRLWWVVLAFVPSSLMLGVTTYLTTDIVAIPLLWVIPLAIYLLTFILAFARRPPLPHAWMLRALPMAVVLLALVLCVGGSHPAWIPVHLLAFFVVALVCHGELARDRPPARDLTGFYLALSLGGVLGGLFNALVAPLVFDRIAEYPLVLVLACLVCPRVGGIARSGRHSQSKAQAEESDSLGPVLGGAGTGDPETPGSVFIAPSPLVGEGRGGGPTTRTASPAGDPPPQSSPTRGEGERPFVHTILDEGVRDVPPGHRGASPPARALAWDLLLPLALGVATAGLIGLIRSHSDAHPSKQIELFLYGVATFVGFTFMDRPLRFALGIAAVLAVQGLTPDADSRVLHQERSFFGVLRVVEADGGKYHRLIHGSTVHGQQSLDPGRRREPLSYYHRTGPIGQVVEVFRQHPTRRSVAVVGLGAGTMAAYAEPDERWTFYEIDPAVARIARDPAYFTFLPDCRAATLAVVLGDARLRLRDAPAHDYGLIVLDAFSSDAIPLHLMTREALALYRAKLANGGLIAFHISNRFLDLSPVLAALARDAGWICRVRTDTVLTSAEVQAGKHGSIWAVLAARAEDLGELAEDPRWQAPPLRPGAAVWTDDFSNVVGQWKVSRH
jgi:spermidine synthase